MKIMVFTEGTATMASGAKGKSREERVQQVLNKEPSIHNFKTHIPNGNAVEKINKWKEQGAEMYYLTSRTLSSEVDDVRHVLEKYNFPDRENLLFRKENEHYNDVAEKLIPDILIEDDCESIGGEIEMTYPHINPKKKRLIKSIVVKEFQGIDHLPDDINQLLAVA